ncbi:DUF6074 family protein [Rhizobiaceae bacterium n13]|uniref:DUF6074 family protein n=1 Tax=Ferirhizobium litorale TaxID=2927786 RepID=UPI0024B2FD84|nr:DUF6074 family protein [Fererhizobium litorale]MDI7865056.1 DUF6074 family protein [Fererhizobium litorale]
MKSQLDMFKAEVIVFPCGRRWLEVQQAARFLNIVHGPNADKWWKKRIQSMASSLRSSGVAEEEIRRQVLAYQEAVQGALWELTNREERA